VFNLFSTPVDQIENENCPKTGEPHKLVQRPDDTEETVAHRLKVYEEKTKPLIEFYREKGLLQSINAEGDVDEITQRLKSALRAASKSPAKRRAADKPAAKKAAAKKRAAVAKKSAKGRGAAASAGRKVKSGSKPKRPAVRRAPAKKAAKKAAKRAGRRPLAKRAAGRKTVARRARR
jgi:adenylate kinase